MRTRKLYYDDPLTLEFETPAVPLLDREGRAGACLPATYFYPTSGGQPHDTGILGAARVTEVTEEPDGGIVQWLDGDPGPGPWRARIDAARRHDHMQQHTGQHILSAAFVEVLDAPTVSFHLGEATCTIDVRLRDAARAAQAEARANLAVAADLPVRAYQVDPGEVEALGLRKPPAVDGPVRVVDVEGFDRSACGGTHVASTGRVQLVKVLGVEKVRDTCRVEFVCGGRALRDYSAKHDSLARLGARLTTGMLEVEPVVERKLEEAASLRRAHEKLEQELAAFEAARMADEATAAGPARLLARLVEGRSPAFLRALSVHLQAREGLVYMLGLACDPPAWILGHGPGVELDLRGPWKSWCTQSGAKGGGKADLIQGGGLAAGTPAEALARAAAALGEALAAAGGAA